MRLREAGCGFSASQMIKRGQDRAQETLREKGPCDPLEYTRKPLGECNYFYRPGSKQTSTTPPSCRFSQAQSRLTGPGCLQAVVSAEESVRWDTATLPQTDGSSSWAHTFAHSNDFLGFCPFRVVFCSCSGPGVLSEIGLCSALKFKQERKRRISWVFPLFKPLMC